MRDFIQNKLRLLFEMVSDRDSDLDIPPIIKYGGPSHGYEAEDIFFMLNVADMTKPITFSSALLLLIAILVLFYKC